MSSLHPFVLIPSSDENVRHDVDSPRGSLYLTTETSETEPRMTASKPNVYQNVLQDSVVISTKQDIWLSTTTSPSVPRPRLYTPLKRTAYGSITTRDRSSSVIPIRIMRLGKFFVYACSRLEPTSDCLASSPR